MCGLTESESNTYPTWTKAFIKEGRRVKVINMKRKNILGKIVSENGDEGNFLAEDMTLYADLTDFKTQLDLGGLDQTNLETQAFRVVNPEMFKATNGKVFGPILTSGSLQDRIANAKKLLQSKKLDNTYLVALDPKAESQLTLCSLGALSKNICLMIGGSSEIHVGTSSSIEPESKGFKILGKQLDSELIPQMQDTVNKISENPEECWIGGSWAYLFRKPKNRIKALDESSTRQKAIADQQDQDMISKLQEISGFGIKITEGNYFRFSREQVQLILQTILNQKSFCELKCNHLTVFNARYVSYLINNLPSIKYIIIGWDGNTV